MIRVAIIDDHDLVRAGIRAILEQDPQFEVVGIDYRHGQSLLLVQPPNVRASNGERLEYGGSLGAIVRLRRRGRRHLRRRGRDKKR